VPHSKKDIAAQIGTTPESLSRLINKLTRRQVLSWEGNTIRLCPGFWDRRDEL
jgi:CRP-like cAMP-binding protein